MPRKKARLKSDGTTGVTEATTEATTASTTSNVPMPRKQLRGRRGGLKDMLNMPLDVLHEVRVFAVAVCIEQHCRRVVLTCGKAEVISGLFQGTVLVALDAFVQVLLGRYL